MTDPIKIFFLLLFGLTSTLHLPAQTLKGKIFNQKDSLPIPTSTVAVYDSAGNVLTGLLPDENGNFVVQLPDNSEYMRIYSFEFVELYIINLNKEFEDTLDFGQLPMIKSTPSLQVQFIGVSERKERRYQRQIIKDYNKKLKEYEDITLLWNDESITVRTKLEDPERSKRLKLSYILNFEDINKKIRPTKNKRKAAQSRSVWGFTLDKETFRFFTTS